MSTTLIVIAGISTGLLMPLTIFHLFCSSLGNPSKFVHVGFLVLFCFLSCVSIAGFPENKIQGIENPQKTMSDCVTEKTTLMEIITERSLNEKEKVKIEEGCSKEFPTMGANQPTKEETKMIIDCITGKTTLMETITERSLNEKEKVKIEEGCSKEFSTMKVNQPTEEEIKIMTDCITEKTTLMETITERSLNEKEKVKIEESCFKELPVMKKDEEPFFKSEPRKLFAIFAYISFFFFGLFALVLMGKMQNKLQEYKS